MSYEKAGNYESLTRSFKGSRNCDLGAMSYKLQTVSRKLELTNFEERLLDHNLRTMINEHVPMD